MGCWGFAAVRRLDGGMVMEFLVGFLLGYAASAPSVPSPPLTLMEQAFVVLTVISVVALLVGALFRSMRKAFR